MASRVGERRVQEPNAILLGMASEVIYVELLDEAVEVYAPVEAERGPDDNYVLPPSAPADQTWAFPPGARVICERRGAELYASSLAPDGYDGPRPEPPPAVAS